MSEAKAVRINKVEYAGNGLQLRLRWAGGTTTGIDLHEPVYRLKGLRPLRDPKFFARVKLGEGGHSIAWPGGIDMGAGRLWELSLQQTARADEVSSSSAK